MIRTDNCPVLAKDTEQFKFRSRQFAAKATIFPTAGFVRDSRSFAIKFFFFFSFFFLSTPMDFRGQLRLGALSRLSSFQPITPAVRSATKRFYSLRSKRFPVPVCAHRLKGLSARSMTKRTYKLKNRAVKNRGVSPSRSLPRRGTFVDSHRGFLSARFSSIRYLLFRHRVPDD